MENPFSTFNMYKYECFLITSILQWHSRFLLCSLTIIRMLRQLCTCAFISQNFYWAVPEILSTAASKCLAPRRVRQFPALLDALKSPILLAVYKHVFFGEKTFSASGYNSWYAKEDNGNYCCLRFPKLRRDLSPPAICRSRKELRGRASSPRVSTLA